MIDTRPSNRLPVPGLEAGFTLVEVLVAMTLALIVFGAITTMLITSQRVQARDAEWALTLQQGRAGLTRMTHEIRQATEIEEHSGSTIVFDATIAGKALKVKYECGVTQSGTEYDECVRYATETKTFPTTDELLVRDVRPGKEVFKCYKGTAEVTAASETNIVTLQLELAAIGTLKQANSTAYHGKHIVLESDAFMRNYV